MKWLILLSSCLFYWAMGQPAPNGALPTIQTAAPILDTCVADTVVCQGRALYFNGQFLTEAGTYFFTEGLPPGCGDVLQLNVAVQPPQEINLDIDLCRGQFFKVGNEVFEESGFYFIPLPSSSGCDSFVYLNLLISFLAEPIITETRADDGSGNGMIKVKLRGNDLRFDWNDGEQSFQVRADTTLCFEGLSAGNYQAVVTNEDSCRLFRTYQVLSRIYDAPNAFTPNGDGVNDYFNLLASYPDPRILEFRVYNRWGQLIYDNDEPEIGWDGSFQGAPQPSDTYFYRIVADRQDGTGEVAVLQGEVALLR